MGNKILDTINSNLPSLTNKSVTLGFDGFVDVIFKVIRSKDDHRVTFFFKSINEFGRYITEKGEKNFSLELEEITTKIGGNMPIMANALAQFGSKQNCIGSLGYPSISPVFKQLPSNCRLFSFADPGLTKALEFNGNKILLAEIGSLNRIEWSAIKDVVGLDRMIDLYSGSDLICMLNWSELDNSTAIWKGLLTDVLQRLPQNHKRPIAFFDLADCSKRTEENISEAMNLLKSFSAYWNVVLSLNLNEATVVNNVLTGATYNESNVEKIGASLYARLQISGVVVHYSKQALYWDASGFHDKESFYIPNPTLSTGAGDNFNAGFCAGMLMGLNAETCLILGHATANFYMANGASPSITELLELLTVKFNIASTPVN